MEELCSNCGGYSRFFWTLMLHYVGWWVAVLAVPALFLDHHRCEANMPYLAWLLYSAILLAMLIMAVFLELSVVQRIGLLRPGDLGMLITDKQWQLPLLSTVLWKLDSYTDVVFIYIARDCGSSLWWASLATFVFGVIFGQLLFNSCFACTDCDKELPRSFGFVLLDFKLVNTAVKHVLPFDPDASDLPVGKPVTLRTASELVGFEKVVGDIAQISIQGLFLTNNNTPNLFVHFSVACGILHGSLELLLTLRECYEEAWASQARGVQMGTVLLTSPEPTAEELAAVENGEAQLLDSSTLCGSTSPAAPVLVPRTATTAAAPLPTEFGKHAAEISSRAGYREKGRDRQRDWDRPETDHRADSKEGAASKEGESDLLL